MYTETLTQRFGLYNGIVPQTLNNAYANTSAVDMSLFKRVMFILYMGAVTGGGNIKATLQDSADGSTWPANDTLGAGPTLQEQALTTASAIVTFEIRADQMAAGKRYLRLNVGETGSENVLVACAVIADEADHKPGNANNGTHVGTNGKQDVQS